jgi:glycosyltransferase involved in cell wall biosynthesis
VLCLGTSEPSPPEAAVNTEVRGVAHGIPFEYACGSTTRSTNFWRRRWSRVQGLLGAARSIRRQRSHGPVEAVLLYSESWLDAAVLHFVCRRVGAAYVADVCEMPYHRDQRPGIPWRVRRSVYNRTFFRWFDAAIAISDCLRRHVVAFGSRDIAVLCAPVMVDTDAFHPAAEAAARPPVVMYCGLLNQEKDGAISLMRAFAGLSADMGDLRLHLVGDAYRSSRIPEFRAVADRLGIADKVTFVGSVKTSDVPAHLARASVLVLARPQSLQADAGMPTKVAEYLASGVPVVITQTGEIAGFLDDGVNAYLVPPDDEAALQEALRYVLARPEEALAVGRRGREVAIRHFDYRVVGARVAAFIAGLTDRSAAGAA